MTQLWRSEDSTLVIQPPMVSMASRHSLGVPGVGISELGTGGSAFPSQPPVNTGSPPGPWRQRDLVDRCDTRTKGSDPIG